jgi:hypothetical protein
VRKLLPVAALAVIAVYALRHPHESAPAESLAAPRTIETAEVEHPAFRCDGRTRCPQMTSCEEATYFLRHCPGVKMDGDNDGVPCEDQWCRN